MKNKANTAVIEATATETVEVTREQRILLAEVNRDAKRADAKSAHEEYLALLPEADIEDEGIAEAVNGILNDIAGGNRGHGVPAILTVMGTEYRVEKDGEIAARIKDAANARVKHLGTKKGRAAVDKAVAPLTCTLFTLRTKKDKDGKEKIAATVKYSS